MSGRVHYFSFYLEPSQAARRVAVPAGFAKVEYVASAAAGAGFDVRVVSTAVAKAGYVPGERGGQHIYLPSWRPPLRAGFAVAVAFMWAQIVRYLLLEVRRGDTVMAYHSLSYIGPLTAAGRLKKFRLVLEFNDLYSAVSEKYRGRKRVEERFIRGADAHLFMNRIAARKFSGGKPHVISYGSYDVPARSVERRDDGCTHVQGLQGSGHGVYTVAALSRLACMFVAEGVVLCPLCVIINMVFHSNIEVGDDGDHDGSTAPGSGARGRGRDRAGGLFGGGPGRGAGLRPR
jgi:hypothetical protein